MIEYLIGFLYVGAMTGIAYLSKYVVTLYQKEYGKHFVLEKPVVMQMVYPPPGPRPPLRMLPYIFVPAFATFLIIALAWYLITGGNTSSGIGWIFSCIFTLSALMLGIQLSGLIVFSYAARHPDAMKGTVHFKEPLINTIKLAQTLLLTLPIIIALTGFINQSSYILGIVIGALYLLMIRVMIFLRDRFFAKKKG
jgi:hypothetical protein